MKEKYQLRICELIYVQKTFANHQKICYNIITVISC